jgi:hypothetical protein
MKSIVLEDIWVMLQPYTLCKVEGTHVWKVKELNRFVFVDEVEQLYPLTFAFAEEAQNALTLYAKCELDGKGLSEYEKGVVATYRENHDRWLKANELLLLNRWRCPDRYRVPVGKRVLIRFSDGHIEDAEFWVDTNLNLQYTLFDGDQLSRFPIGWMEIPDTNYVVK